MARFKDAVEEKWQGGVEGYARTELGLTNEEVQAVKRALRGQVLN